MKYFKTDRFSIQQKARSFQWKVYFAFFIIATVRLLQLKEWYHFALQYLIQTLNKIVTKIQQTFTMKITKSLWYILKGQNDPKLMFDRRHIDISRDNFF